MRPLRAVTRVIVVCVVFYFSVGLRPSRIARCSCRLFVVGRRCGCCLPASVRALLATTTTTVAAVDRGRLPVSVPSRLLLTPSFVDECNKKKIKTHTHTQTQYERNRQP